MGPPGQQAALPLHQPRTPCVSGRRLDKARPSVLLGLWGQEVPQARSLGERTLDKGRVLEAGVTGACLGE